MAIVIPSVSNCGRIIANGTFAPVAYADSADGDARELASVHRVRVRDVHGDRHGYPSWNGRVLRVVRVGHLLRHDLLAARAQYADFL